MDRLKSTWEDLGRSDPLWAVLTDPARRHGGWVIDEFLATARAPVTRVLRLLDRAGLSLGDRVLDFGCGAGRLANALAAHTRDVVGVDIAQSMVDHANRINRVPERVRFEACDGSALPFGDESFDAVVSLISLQHSPPAVQLACLVELQRVVRPGGALVFQLPSRPKTPEALPADAMRAHVELLDVPNPLGAGQAAPVRTRLTNVSTFTWPAGRMVRLGNHWFAGSEPVRWNDGRVDLPRDLRPGQSVELSLPVVAPDEPGGYDLEIDVVQEAVAWWADAGNTPVRVPMTVVPGAVAVPALTAHTETADLPAAHGRDDGGMEMYGMSANLVRALFIHCGSEVLAVEPDDMAGAEWESFTYVVRRGASG